MPESIPASLIIDTLKDTFREARAWLAAEVAAPPRHPHLGWILSVPDTHQRTVLAALDKEQAIRVLTGAIAAARGDAICVPTMTTAPAWRTLAPDDLSVTCVGFMGGASALGLGLALACPDRRVVVLDGDGSLLMQLGSLATIAGARPRNLTHLVFKNGVYHTSGAQDIPGGLDVDFVVMAKGAGYRNAYAIKEPNDFTRRLPTMLTEEGPVLVELYTGLAEKTPMTDRGGLPFHRQAETLRTKLRGPRG